MTTITRRLLGALTWPHGIDRYVEQVRPAAATDEVRATVVAVAHHTPLTTTLTLRPNRSWQGGTAGQFVRLSVEVDGRRKTRCYSIASSDHRAKVHGGDGCIELTAKAIPGGAVSNHLLAHAKAGDVVTISQADGDFTLPAERPRRILLISGGSGITPVLGMIRTLADEGYDGHVTFLHYALTEADVLARAELAALAQRPGFDVVLGLVDEPGSGDLDGLFGASHLDAVCADLADAETYVCGPAPLMAAVEALFAERGLSDHLHVEAFAGAPIPARVDPDAPPTGTLTFRRSGLTVANDGRSVLEQAEAAGLTPDAGCRRGICGTCVRPKPCGAVLDLVTGLVTSDPDVKVRLCTSAPVGDVSVEA